MSMSAEDLNMILKHIDKSETSIKSDLKSFRDDAEIKINNMGMGIKDDMSNKINGVNSRLEKFDKRLERIENRDKMIEKHDFKIKEIEKDLNQLGEKTDKDITKLSDDFQAHLKDHNKELPKNTINFFKTKVMWYVYGGAGLTILTVIIYMIFKG